MAEFGVPLLMLLGASGYAYWKYQQMKPQKPLDGGKYDPGPAQDAQVEGGVLKTMVVDDGAVTNPGLGIPIAASRPPGAVRGSLIRGADPFNTLEGTAGGKNPPRRPNTNPGEKLFPPGRAQYGPKDGKLISRPERVNMDPAISSPAPLSGLLQIMTHGAPHKKKMGIFSATDKQMQHFHNRMAGSDVPRDYTKIDPLTGADPSDSTFWDNKPKKIMAVNVNNRNPATEKTQVAKPNRFMKVANRQ